MTHPHKGGGPGSNQHAQKPPRPKRPKRSDTRRARSTADTTVRWAEDTDPDDDGWNDTPLSPHEAREAEDRVYAAEYRRLEEASAADLDAEFSSPLFDTPVRTRAAVVAARRGLRRNLARWALPDEPDDLLDQVQWHVTAAGPGTDTLDEHPDGPTAVLAAHDLADSTDPRATVVEVHATGTRQAGVVMARRRDDPALRWDPWHWTL